MPAAALLKLSAATSAKHTGAVLTRAVCLLQLSLTL